MWCCDVALIVSLIKGGTVGVAVAQVWLWLLLWLLRLLLHLFLLFLLLLLSLLSLLDAVTACCLLLGAVEAVCSPPPCADPLLTGAAAGAAALAVDVKVIPTLPCISDSH